MTRETRQEREKRLAEALRRNLGRRKQAKRDPPADQPAGQEHDKTDTTGSQ